MNRPGPEKGATQRWMCILGPLSHSIFIAHGFSEGQEVSRVISWGLRETALLVRQPYN